MKMETLNTTYDLFYVVLELPFNVLLVYQMAFQSFDDAEDQLRELPWFYIWESAKYNEYEGKKIFIPLKPRFRKNIYKVNIVVDAEIVASDERELDRIVKRMSNIKSTKIHSIKTTITNRLVSLRGKYGR